MAPGAPIELVDMLPDLERLPAQSRHRWQLSVTRLADGNRVALPVNVIVGRSPRPRVVIVAGVHGNEGEGPRSLLELSHEIQPSDLDGTLVMVPVVNPPAFQGGLRMNPTDPVDMNRIFPGTTDGGITDRIAHRLFHDVVLGADLLASLHSWTADGAIAPYVEYARDMPISGTARAAAAAFGLAYIAPLDWSRAGLLTAAASRAGIPSIEPEIGGGGVTLPANRVLYKRGVRRLLQHLHVLPATSGDSGDGASTAREIYRHRLVAPVGGALHVRVAIGEEVEVGDVMASITDLNGSLLAEIASPVAGTVGALRMMASVDPGQLVAIVFVMTA